MDAMLKNIYRARVRMLQQQPFFGYLACELVPKEENTIPTMATDGRKIYYSRDYVKSLTEEQLMFAVAHEVQHLILDTIGRQGTRIPELWNVATDYTINLILKDSGFDLAPKVLVDEKYRGKTAEWIYRDIMKNAKKVSGSCCSQAEMGEQLGKKGKNSKGAGSQGQSKNTAGAPQGGQGSLKSGQGSPGGNIQPQKPSQAEKDKVREDWKQKVARATMLVKRSKGTLAGSLEESIESVYVEKVDWRSMLWRFVQDTARNDYTYSRINKKYAHMGIYLPTLKSEGFERIVIAVDTSGSISDKDLREFLGEIRNIADQFEIQFTLIAADSEIRNVYEFDSSSSFQGEDEIKLGGRGGTSHIPVFEYVEEHDLNPRAMICLTDGYTDIPEEPPGYSVLWILNEDGGEEYLAWGDITSMAGEMVEV